MKKILISLLVLALCAPAMAVTFTLTAGTGGQVSIGMDTGTDVVRGVAIKVTAAGGLTSLTPAAINPAFNCFIDYAHDAGAAYTAVGQGHPFAVDGAAGAIAAPGAGVTAFVISMGVLDEGGNQAGYTGAGNLITFVAGNGQVCISADTLRGPDSAVVGDVTLTSNIASVPCVTAVVTVPVCNTAYNFSKLTGGTDNALNATDLNNLIAWVNACKTGTTFAVGGTNPCYTTLVPGQTYTYGSVYNLTLKLGGTDTAVNATDLNTLISFVNAHKTGTTFAVNCLTCGC